MSNQSDHHSIKPISGDISRRHFIQASSALVTLPFFSSNTMAATQDHAIAEKRLTPKRVSVLSLPVVVLTVAENVIFARTLKMAK